MYVCVCVCMCVRECVREKKLHSLLVVALIWVDMSAHQYPSHLCVYVCVCMYVCEEKCVYTCRRYACVVCVCTCARVYARVRVHV